MMMIHIMQHSQILRLVSKYIYTNLLVVNSHNPCSPLTTLQQNLLYGSFVDEKLQAGIISERKDHSIYSAINAHIDIFVSHIYSG